MGSELSTDIEEIAERYRAVRTQTDRLCAPLSVEDQVVQSMPDASPTKWHRAHTTWFFETFLLKQLSGYRPFDEVFEYLFNSYYNAVGEQFPRPHRGVISRPSVSQITAYREHVDHAMIEALAENRFDSDLIDLVVLGTHHEQQHQELIATDIKHMLSQNPLEPAYLDGREAPASVATERSWTRLEGGIERVGHDGLGFCFDNELPVHDVIVPDFEIATRPVTN
ncbi:MAG: DinB family protein, partial [Myxococcales bacterium]|nr:DinB family protein [Myxococcales bacterium]